MADSKGVLGQLNDAAKNNPAVDRVRDEARDYLQARGKQFAKSLGGKLEDATQSMEQGAEGGGFIGKSAQKLAEGQSPGKAVAGGLAGGLKDKVKGVLGGGGKPKVTNIIEDIDVGVPVSVAYNQWTQFAEFPEFTKGVEEVNQEDDVKSTWKVKVFKSGRRMTTTITEQVPDRRIAWTSDGEKGTTKGIVTFHPLADDLTRILLVLEYSPGGFMEKTGNLWRAQGRRARLDLKHFRRYLMMSGEESGAWRGEVRDSEVVRTHEEVEEQERSEDKSERGKGEQDESEQSQQGEDRSKESQQAQDKSEQDSSKSQQSKSGQSKSGQGKSQQGKSQQGKSGQSKNTSGKGKQSGESGGRSGSEAAARS